MISLVCLVSLIVWELVHPQPVVNIRLLGYRSFGICCGLMFLVGFLLISTTQLLPQLAQSLLGYDATTCGVDPGRRRNRQPVADAGRRYRHRSVRPTEMADPDGRARHRLVDASAPPTSI